MKYTLGRFGKQVKEYEKARREYPKEIFQYLKSLIKQKQPSILDLGCGTGISTRQLISVGKVIGCDPDHLMLQAAKKHKTNPSIKYVTGSAEKLPFPDNSFDSITAFAAFHWFDNKTSIREIKRILKTNGILFIVNRRGLKTWGEGYRKTIIKAIGRNIATFRENNYNPKSSLIENSFKQVTAKSWKKSELYTIENAVEYVQSVSIWESIPAKLKPIATYSLLKYFQRMKKNKGKIERKYTMRVVVGIK